MTDVERLRLFRAAARNTRKLNRTLQSQSERLETWLDRQVARKARADEVKIVAVADGLFKSLRTTYANLENSMADLYASAAQ